MLTKYVSLSYRYTIHSEYDIHIDIFILNIVIFNIEYSYAAAGYTYSYTFDITADSRKHTRSESNHTSTHP